MEAKPKRVKARITRTVFEIAIVELDRDGNIEDVIEVCEEIDFCDGEVYSIHSVLSVHE